LETRLQVLEGRELGKSAGSTKGKPKIEVYEKDRKKGTGALTTPAKTYNPAADLVLTEETPKKSELASKKRKHNEVETEPLAEPAEEAIQEDEEEEKEQGKQGGSCW
ncbi:putative nucleolar protein 5-1, partial [Zea mays]